MDICDHESCSIQQIHDNRLKPLAAHWHPLACDTRSGAQRHVCSIDEYGMPLRASKRNTILSRGPERRSSLGIRWIRTDLHPVRFVNVAEDVQAGLQVREARAQSLAAYVVDPLGEVEDAIRRTVRQSE